jgi:hypothetical protein
MGRISQTYYLKVPYKLELKWKSSIWVLFNKLGCLWDG